MKKSKLYIQGILCILFLQLVSLNQASASEPKKQITIKWQKGDPVLLINKSITRQKENLAIYEDENGPYLAYEFPLNNHAGFTYLIKDDNNILDPGILNERKEGSVAIASKERSGLILIPLQAPFEDQTQRLTINVNLSQQTTVIRPKRRSAGSVLASGSWYKFGIPETGVYKLDYDFIASLGMDVNNISTNSYSVFGHKGGMLPKLAGDARTDDLIEIPILVVSNSSTMQPGDYILFYGEGQDIWRYSEDLEYFQHEKHLYSDHKGYFITPDAGTGKRIGNANTPSGSSAITFSNFDDRVFIEDDLVNLNKSGSDWLGDEFSVTTQKTYTFPFPGITAGYPVQLELRTAARSGTLSAFNFSYNGSQVASTNINSVNLGSYTAPVASSTSTKASFNASGNEIAIVATYNQPSFSSSGWLDYMALNVRRSLSITDNQLLFRHKDALDHNIVTFQVSNTSGSTNIWDVTDLFNIGKVDASINGSTANFKANGGSISEYIAFNDSNLEPIAFGAVSNQDLHGLADADMIIITRSPLRSAANEIAAFHQQKEGLVTHVVTLDQVQNEFASGNQDVSAIRDFLKMFYDRNNDVLKYALLLGDGTFNNKDLDNFDLPTYQSDETLVTLSTYVSDDFFGFLDDEEGDDISSVNNKLDIAVGRIPAASVNSANIAVKKIKRYYDEPAFGNWRNVGTYIADDEDSNLHFSHAEENSNDFIADIPIMNIEKIYLDAFRQQAGSGGGFYPDVNQAINRRLFKGTLFLNYIGHGGTNGLAEERVVRLEDIDTWDNNDKLTLFISATCEFTRYDDFSSFSAGERTFFKEDGGAIALVTTVRLVFASKNRQMNLNFMEAMKEGMADRSLTIGDITRIAKNNTNTGDGNRKFTLIGDPALKIAFPVSDVVTTKINQQDYSSTADTLEALTTVTINGEVRTNDGQLMSGFNGLVYPTVYDKAKTLSTLANDDGSNIAPFDVQSNIIYAGKVQAFGGKFSYTFVVPRDIIYAVGDGKISYYAHDGLQDAAGIDTVLVGGGGELDSSSIDNDDPLVEVFMDDESWISGDFTTPDPDLLVKLFDDNGINTVGSGVGHDITAILDGDEQNAIVLNDFYESELNSYQSGIVLYPLEEIPAGTHTVKVKAWDVFNNSGEGSTEFVIAEAADLALDHVLNYPNPFTTSTKFMFEHNRKGDVLDVRIEIFSVSGKLVKTIQETAMSDERRVELNWDGLDQYGDKIGKGIYVYRVTVKDSSGEKAEEFQKLVLLR